MPVDKKKVDVIMPVLDVIWQQIPFCCQIYIQPNIFDKYTSTVFLPVVKMAMSLSQYKKKSFFDVV